MIPLEFGNLNLIRAVFSSSFWQRLLSNFLTIPHPSTLTFMSVFTCVFPVMQLFTRVLVMGSGYTPLWYDFILPHTPITCIKSLFPGNAAGIRGQDLQRVKLNPFTMPLEASYVGCLGVLGGVEKCPRTPHFSRCPAGGESIDHSAQCRALCGQAKGHCGATASSSLVLYI